MRGQDTTRSTPAAPAPDPTANHRKFATERRFYLAGVGGLDIAGSGTSLAVGSEAGYLFKNRWGAGAYFEYLNHVSSTSTAGTSAAVAVSVMLIAAELDYFITPNFHLGGKAGVGIVAPVGAAASSFSGPASTLGAAVGGAAGYDLWIHGGLSIGAEINSFVLLGASSGEVAAILGVLKLSI